MRKFIIGLFCGVIVIPALVVALLGSLSSVPATGESGGSEVTEMSSDNTTFREDVYSLLQEAGNEIQDSDTSQYYQKLIQGYELDEPLPELPEGEEPSPADILPDITKINQIALTLPLQEAGKNIQDDEIAEFYYSLLESAGFTIGSQ
jgi:hypothetical protein